MAADGAAPCGAVVLVRYRCADGEFAESRLDRVRVDRLISGLPVREFRWFRGRRFYSGWYWSATAKRLVAYESRLELARILLADFDRSVVGIAAQPFQLVGDDGGRTRRHVPDLLLLHESGAVTVVDVKPRHRLSDQEVAAVFGWTERVVSARHSRRGRVRTTGCWPTYVSWRATDAARWCASSCCRSRCTWQGHAPRSVHWSRRCRGQGVRR
jgi:hypothetical protein